MRDVERWGNETPWGVSSEACAVSRNALCSALVAFSCPHAEQRRPSLTYEPILGRVARERAADLAQRQYFGHTNPDGLGPNTLVRQAGYVLPSFYNNAPDGNNIESLTAGSATAEAAWERWMNSPPHRMHFLGLDRFFAEQIEYGVGYASDPASPYRHYWAILTARRGP